MPPLPIRVLLLADTHLGFDLPAHPRIARRRRGDDFFANYARALAPALGGDADLVVHGGDLFFRSRVPPRVVERALRPLVQVANAGVPVAIVPGNHERARIPLHLWTGHPGLRLFDEPKTITFRTTRGVVALSGFPFSRRIRDEFDGLLSRTDHRAQDADVHLLCMHQTVEGARVGPSEFTFRSGKDVLRGDQIPGTFAAVLCGHIHRSQRLTHDLSGRELAAPVVYPGSIERTSFAERNEPKHYVLAEFEPGRGRGRMGGVSFVEMPARPMAVMALAVNGDDRDGLGRRLRKRFTELDPNAVVRVLLSAGASEGPPDGVSAAWLRSLAPATMNVSLVPARVHRPGRPRLRAEVRG